jgi:carboxylate-amine ligase
MSRLPSDSPGADALRALFDEPAPMTVGVEDEVMVLDAATHDLAPRAAEVLAILGEDPRFKPELPASQLEIVTPPLASAREAADHLARARRDLVQAGADEYRFATVGLHPFAVPEGPLTAGER